MVLKCEVCGAELEVDDTLTVGTCRYCDSKIIISKNKEKIENLFNYATFLRQSNDFTKAMDVYEELLREDETDAAAHWGMVLSKYGIEYVDDALSSEKKPTCHRIQNTTILDDYNYKAAMQYADLDQSYIFEREAKRIETIHSRFQKIVGEEPPYDIFICYKESDEAGNRTEDSVYAQDIYNALEKEGFHIFFARKTLEKKLGEEYEPYIYAALQSSRVMLIIGTKSEHFNAVWVKNEWSRFLELRQTGEEKTVIPCYKEMSVYEMPRELATFQALDIGKIGFIQDLTDGIKKIVKKTQADFRDKVIDNPVDKMFKNAQTFLKLGETDKAEKIYVRMTEEEPDDYRGWWGRALIQSENYTNYKYKIYQLISSYVNKAFLVVPMEKRKELESEWNRYKEKCENIHKREEEERKIKELKEWKEGLETKVSHYSDNSVEIEGLKQKIQSIEEKKRGYHGILDEHKRVNTNWIFYIALIIDLLLAFVIGITEKSVGYFFLMFIGFGILLAVVAFVIFFIIESMNDAAVKVRNRQKDKFYELQNEQISYQMQLERCIKEKNNYLENRKQLKEIKEELQKLEIEKR